MGLYDFTFYDLINRNAVAFGKQIAWLDADDNRTMSFAQCRERINRLARGLQYYGIKKGDRIAVLAKNSFDYFLLFGGAAALGAIIVPLNWRLSAEEVYYNLNDCRPKMVFADKEYQPLLLGLRERLCAVEEYVGLGPDGHHSPFLDFDLLTDKGSDFSAPPVSSDDGFVIIYTAAVAGNPRGAILSHGNVLLADMHFDYFMHITSMDTHLSFLPFFHVGGLFMATAAYHAGALNINLSKFDATKAAELIEQKKVSVMMVFSPILSSLLDEYEKKGRDIRSLRAVTGIDAPETIERYQRTIDGTFYCMYGQTETSCLASFSRYNEGPGSAGRVLPLAEVRLVNDYDQPVPAGETGEIVMKGPMIFKGYWNLPDDTAYTFREGWHHTGDLGRFNEQGFLCYAGRKPDKELIKPGGENVYPAEVEKVILQHPAVMKTVVFGVPDPKWKEGIKAVCVLKKDEKLEHQALIAFVGERIARYKKPQYVQFVEEIPLLPDGTIDKVKVKALYGGGA